MTSKYSYNSPYAFSENRVIDGVELEGLEYIEYYVFLERDGTSLIKTVKVNDFRKMSDEKIQEIHGMSSKEFYKKNSASYGEKGKGILFRYFVQDSRTGSFMRSSSVFEEKSNMTYHGLYYGAGAPTQQGNRSSVPEGSENNKFTYHESAIDKVDGFAKEHDQNYNLVDAEDFQSDPKGLVPDLVFIERLKKICKEAKDPDYIDKVTGRKPSEEALYAANKVDNLFKGKVSE